MHEARRWLRIARVDCAVAEENSVAGPDRAAVACFHAQQCVEKAIKAVLVAGGIDPPRTHHLNLLVQLLPHDSNVLLFAAELVELSAYAVEARYAGEWDEPSEEDAQRAVRVARKVLDATSAEIEEPPSLNAMS